jgi:hypothetical protein
VILLTDLLAATLDELGRDRNEEPGELGGSEPVDDSGCVGHRFDSDRRLPPQRPLPIMEGAFLLTAWRSRVVGGGVMRCLRLGRRCPQRRSPGPGRPAGSASGWLPLAAALKGPVPIRADRTGVNRLHLQTQGHPRGGDAGDLFMRDVGSVRAPWRGPSLWRAVPGRDRRRAWPGQVTRPHDQGPGGGQGPARYSPSARMASWAVTR